MLALEDLLEAADRVGDRDLPSFAAGEDLRGAERLTEEALDLARAEDGLLVFGGELVHPEDGDDVLQILEPLEHLLDPPGDVVVFLADDLRCERARRRRQRIDGGIDAELGDRALEDDGRIEVGEGRRRRRVGEVVGRARRPPGTT